MKLTMQRMLFWTPWIVLAILGAAYGSELLREMSVWGWTLADVLLHFGVAGILVFALALIIAVGEQEYQAGAMQRGVQRLLFWAPRIAALLFGISLGMLALDVFSEGYSFWETVLALLIHLIPAGILLLAVGVAWRWEWVGAVVLIGWAVLYLAPPWVFPISVYVELAGLPFALGVLFLLNWWYRGELRTRRHAPRPSEG